MQTEVKTHFYYPKCARLLKRPEYRQVSSRAVRKTGACVFVEFIRKGTGPSRLGLTASKKYGPAVLRNRFKRCVREAFRTLKIGDGLWINVHPTKGAVGASMQRIKNDLIELLNLENC